MKSWLFRSLVFICLFAIGASHVTAVPQVADRNVLVLHSYHKGLSWTESITSGIESVFQNQNVTNLKVHLFHEFMDTKRFEEIDYQELLVPVLKYKADRVHYDLIISVDDAALQFLFKHREEIFGRPVPVVFCGVNFYTPEMFKGKKNYTGVVEAFAAKDTIDLALKLHPNTKEFVVVGDDSVTSVANNKSLQKVEGDYKARGIRFRYLTDADIESYRRIIERLEPGSIVLAMLFNRDDRGRYYTFEEAFQRYAGLSKVPVYTYWDFYLNYGTVGGKIISGQNQGETAASLAIRVLDQVPIETIPVVTESPNEYIFDYNQLQHFGIKLSDLPRESRIINEPATFIEFYEKYRSYILGILALVVFLIVVIMVLSANIQKRIQSEKRLIETNTAYYRFVPKEFLDFLNKRDIIDVQPGDCVRQEMSILFSDIRSFTTLSEGMSPEDNFSFINSYLSYISPAIRNHGGFIDKFIGDAIMALFPGPPESVLQAANEMMLRLIDFNQERSSRGLKPVKIGIGIHRGDLMLGTVGEKMRIDSTVISDAVNLASRLESLTKTFGARIIVSEEVVESLGEKKDLFLKRYLGRVNVKGKTKPVVTYEWIEAYPALEKEFMIRTKFEFEEAVRLVEKGRNNEAKILLEKILEKSPDDHAAQYFFSRVR
ncbi:MAG: hypothetical protein H3C43_00180 [Leptonema sp. (in: Bacteria)]|nr:hypothetical protein [Leptonema sp. (in: bacteria)]